MRKTMSSGTRDLTLCFQVRFHTRFGQSLYLSGSHPLLGGSDVSKAVPLTYVNEELWEVTVRWPADAVRDIDINYCYVLRDVDGAVICDWGANRVLNPAALPAERMRIIDSWNNAGFYENAFYTEPFREVLLRANHTAVKTSAPPTPTHTFRVKSLLLKKGQTVCLMGSSAAMANWNTAAPILLNREAGGDYFTAMLDLRDAAFPLEYKYGVYDVEAGAFVRFEDRANRKLYAAPEPGGHTVVNDGFLVLPCDGWKGAGVAIPVFSLRSERSFGAGEFTDLKLLVDWCRQTGLKVIQILPVNDTRATHTWVDSYPYAAISAFALHPLYLNLSQVAEGENKRLLKDLEMRRKKLNGLDKMDYEAVMEGKIGFVKRIYPLQKQKTFKSKAYKSFFEANKHWLVPYSAFCYLRDKYGTSNFNEWPAYSRFKAAEIEALAAEGSAVWDEIAINYFIQFHLHLQLKAATEYAHANGIIVKGDIAIGVYRFGADAWQQPELYHMEMQAGAPPDAFAVKGQNWGFPTYNWPRMKEDGFAWWRRRFEQMSCYFDAFRIDHILGFFRIWSIPMSAVEGILGRFVPAIPVQPSEFRERGIPFDLVRYTRPHITDRILAELFGECADAVKAGFLVKEQTGSWALKPEFATQRQVEAYFARIEQTSENQRLKRGLFDSISNVILLVDENGEFHFRFDMEKTRSFRDLDEGDRTRMKELYVEYFFRRQDVFWKDEAMQKLPALKRVTNMLICGEDLGLVPACVPEVMKNLGFLSLEIQRMPKNPHEEFFRPSNAPYLSVVTPSTHDMSTIRGWWEEDRAVTQRFYNAELGRRGDAPVTCGPEINREIVNQHMASPAMWSIFQLQDLLGMDARLSRKDFVEERINVPAISGYYWRYRMHLTLEELNAARAFNSEVKEMVGRNGRGG